MKTTLYRNSTVLALVALAIACMGANADEAVAGKNKATSNPTGLVELKIELHAPNSSTPTVTVWVPEFVASRQAGTAIGECDGKEINLPASNNSGSSVTVWCGRR